MLLFGGAALFLLWRFAQQWREIKFGEDWLFGLAFSAALCLVFGLISGVLLCRMLFRPVTQTRLDDAGIKIDGRLTAWSEVDAVYPLAAAKGRRGDTRWVVGYQLRSPLPLSLRRSLAMPSMTWDEYCAIAAPLAEFLREHHPHVAVETGDTDPDA